MTAFHTPGATLSRLAYDDVPSPREMYADCEAVGRALPLSGRVRPDLASAVAAPAPSIRYEDHPRDVAKQRIEVSEAAQRLANALHLHLD